MLHNNFSICSQQPCPYGLFLQISKETWIKIIMEGFKRFLLVTDLAKCLSCISSNHKVGIITSSV